MASDSGSKERKSNSKEGKEQKKGSDRGRSSSSSSSSSRSKRSRSGRSESRQKGSRYQGGYQRREPEKIAPNTKLFVTNIDSKFSQEELDRELRALFEPFGSIKEIIVKTKQGSSNSYCFIEYQDVDSAAKAQSELRGKDFKGKQLKVEFGRGERKNEDRRSDKCYICHKEGHFAKDCRFNRFSSNDDKGRRDDRGRDRDYRDRDYDKDRDYKDKDRRDTRRRKYSRSSSSNRSYRQRNDRDREDYRRRDTRRSPEKRSSNYNSSSNRRY